MIQLILINIPNMGCLHLQLHKSYFKVIVLKVAQIWQVSMHKVDVIDINVQESCLIVKKCALLP